MKHRIALVGFGNVGQGLTEILLEKREELETRYGFEFNIVGISDIAWGTAYNPNGLDITAMLAAAKEKKKFSQDLKDWDALTMIKKSNATVVCEMAFTDLKTGEPAISHCKAAFETGKHIVTSNKGPAALAYRELRDMAAKKKAQELGYAEADPSGDVEGYDARGKVTILANVVMNTSLKIEDVACKGITQITLADIEKAKKAGSRWKLIGSVKKEGDKITAAVVPEMLPLSHPLAGVMGATNAITFTTDLLGEVSVVGPGAGRTETGFSILTDLLRIHNS
jgi:homoserine dehydrogenase